MLGVLLEHLCDAAGCAPPPPCRPEPKAAGHSDVDFVRKLLEELGSKLCLDTTQYHVSGMSNGAMLTYHLLQSLPVRTFRAAVPVYGHPLVGFLKPRSGLHRVPLLHIHDRTDTIIPVDGGVTADGWIYYAVELVLAAYARPHGCLPFRSPMTTPQDGGDRRVACDEFEGCRGRVGYCAFDGEHGDWFAGIEALAFWFFDSASGPVAEE